MYYYCYCFCVSVHVFLMFNYFLLHRYYIGIAIGCYFLLVIVLLYFGLAFGVFAEAPDEYEDKTVSTKTGADFLMALVQNSSKIA